MRRCSVSIPSNIAEGRARRTDADFAHFLDVALGSLAELYTQTTIAYNLKYLSEEDYKKVIDECAELELMI